MGVLQTQAEQNKNLNSEIKSIQEKFNETKKQTNEKIAVQEQEIIKQKEITIELIDNLSSDISTKINSVSQTQAEQKKNLNGEINSIQDDFNKNKKQTTEQIAVQEQRITKQKEDLLKVLDNLSSDISTKINSVSLTQKEQHNNLDIEIKSIQDNLNENKKQTNEQIALQERKIIKQKEDIIELIDNLSSDVFTKINAVSQAQAEQNQNLNREINLFRSDIVSIKNKLKTQEIQLSKKIIIAFIIAGIFGSISLIHLILNILGIL
jgi:hypothetical protein